MKNKSLWLLATSLGVLCVWMAFGYYDSSKLRSIIGIQPGALVLSQSALPVLHWGDLNRFGDLGLKIKTKTFVNLAEAVLEQTVRYNELTYTQVQAGLFLTILNGERVFILADSFTPESLNPTVALEFTSDWTVLQRSSLLPENWPEPSQGWIVLGSQISEGLKTKSLETQKPVLRPESAGTVWLEKTPESDWFVTKP
jgi:hypothetical protein